MSDFSLHVYRNDIGTELQINWHASSSSHAAGSASYPLTASAEWAAVPGDFSLDLVPVIALFGEPTVPSMKSFRALPDWQVLRELLTEIGVAELLDNLYRFCFQSHQDGFDYEYQIQSRGDSLSSAPNNGADITSRTNINNRLLRVWYATCREKLDEGTYGEELSSKGLHFGSCLVHIPESHQPGDTGSWWRRYIPLVTDDNIKLRDVRSHEYEAHWRGINTALASWDPDERNLFVYLHGYNSSFEDAAVRAAQIGYDLKIPGEMSFFSWPSQDITSKYTVDEDRIEASTQAISDYLAQLCSDSLAVRVHLFVHSMGNRGLLNALERLAAQRHDDLSLGWVFLCAPDVGAHTFEQQFDFLARQCEHATLLTSNKDKALNLSQWLHDSQRAGSSIPDIPPLKLDSLYINDARFYELGHGYFADNETVLADMHQAVNERKKAAERTLPRWSDGYYVLD